MNKYVILEYMRQQEREFFKSEKMKINSINLADYVILQNKLSGEYVSSATFTNLITINDMQCAKLFTNDMFVDYFFEHQKTITKEMFNIIEVKIGVEILEKPTEHQYSANYSVLQLQNKDEFLPHHHGSPTGEITLAKLFKNKIEVELFLHTKYQTTDQRFLELPVAVKIYPFTRIER